MAYLNQVPSQVNAVDAFGGLNRRERIGDGEWADAENLTTEQYPVAMTRERRTFTRYWQTRWSRGLPQGHIVDAIDVDGDAYILVDSGEVYVPSGEIVKTKGNPVSLVKFGLGAFTNTGTWIQYDHDRRPGEDVKTKNTDYYSIMYGFVDVVDMNGESIEITYRQASEPTETITNGAYWYDTSNNGLYRYSENKEEWVPIVQSCIRLLIPPGANISEYFNVGDGITVDVEDAFQKSSFVIREIGNTWREVSGVNTSFDTILFDGLCLPTQGDNPVGILIERRMPVLDLIVEWNNRIWGCRYGKNDKGAFVNEIYGSGLGDCFNWFRYEGTAADSYTASVGSGGVWTGIGATEDGVFFFKKDRVFLLTGSEPSNFRLREIEGPGVRIGSEKSLVRKNGELYYQTEAGFAKISGYGYPVLISENIRGLDPGNVIGGIEDEKIYWVGASVVLVYEMRTGMWMTQSPLSSVPVAMFGHRGYLTCIGEKRIAGVRFFADETKKNNAEIKAAEYGISGTIKIYCYKDVCQGAANVLVGNNIYATLANAINSVQDFFYLMRDQYAVECPELSNIQLIDFVLNNAWASYEDAEYPCTDITFFRLVESGAFGGISDARYIMLPDPEGAVQWYGETGPRGLRFLGGSGYRMKQAGRVRKIQVQVKTPEESTFRLFVMFGEDGVWERVRDEKRGKIGTYTIPVRDTVRSDVYRLRFEGEGDAVIYGVYEVVEEDGENE